MGWIIVPLVLVDAFIAYRLLKYFFPGKGELLEALRYSFQPWWLSMLRGEWGADIRSTLKLFVAIVPSIVLLALEVGLMHWIGVT